MRPTGPVALFEGLSSAQKFLWRPPHSKNVFVGEGVSSPPEGMAQIVQQDFEGPRRAMNLGPITECTPGPWDGPSYRTEDFFHWDQAQWAPGPEEWKKSVAMAVGEIRQGLYEKITLSRAIGVPHRCKNLDSLLHWEKIRPLFEDTECYFQWIQWGPGQVYISATPESLFFSEGPWSIIQALAATVPRGPTPEEDRALEQELTSSPKLLWEHSLVEQDIEQKLARANIDFEKIQSQTIKKLAHVQHLSSLYRVPRQRADVWCSLLHPTAAIGAFPPRAHHRIRELEGRPRGPYAGVVGFSTPDREDFSVGLRCLVLHKDMAWAFVGCGITKDSDPQKEWEESCHKLKNFFSP